MNYFSFSSFKSFPGLIRGLRPLALFSRAAWNAFSTLCILWLKTSNSSLPLRFGLISFLFFIFLHVPTIQIHQIKHCSINKYADLGDNNILKCDKITVSVPKGTFGALFYFFSVFVYLPCWVESGKYTLPFPFRFAVAVIITEVPNNVIKRIC